MSLNDVFLQLGREGTKELKACLLLLAAARLNCLDLLFSTLLFIQMLLPGIDALYSCGNRSGSPSLFCLLRFMHSHSPHAILGTSLFFLEFFQLFFFIQVTCAELHRSLVDFSLWKTFLPFRYQSALLSPSVY